MFRAGIPHAAFEVDDVRAEHVRLARLGVTFSQEPTEMGPLTFAIFADTCGNLIQLYQGEAVGQGEVLDRALTWTG